MEKRSCGCAARAKSKAEKNAELTKDAKAIVAEVEGYSKADRTKKAAEVKAAFPPETAAKAATVKSAAKTTAKAVAKPVAKKTAAKPAAKKQPTPAGMSKGSHDGDQC